MAADSIPANEGAQSLASRTLAGASDLLDFVNRLDRLWHAQPRDYEREALTRFFTLVTLPARLISSDRPARLAQESTILRNVRFTGASVRDIFFRDQNFTEVDAIFFNVGSSAGHLGGGDSYVVEVERKALARNRDYYRAMQRSRKISLLFQRIFDAPLLPVVVFDDREGSLNYGPYDDDLVVLPMTRLQELTSGVPILLPDEIPGRSSDRTMVKLAILWLLARTNPDDPRMARTSARRLIELARREGVPLHLPALGHLDLDRFHGSLGRWLTDIREDDRHLERKRIGPYLTELCESGAAEIQAGSPILTRQGGEVVLQFAQYLDRGLNHA